MKEITQLLHAANAGDGAASQQLFALMYADLKRLARGNLYRSGSIDDLNTTAVVNESFLRMAESGGLAPSDRPAFFAYVARSCGAWCWTPSASVSPPSGVAVPTR
jgi:hypothetical protein